MSTRVPAIAGTPLWGIENGQSGDNRERLASAFVQQASPSGDPEASLRAFEEFHACHRPLLHVGDEKGRHLDEALAAKAPMRVLEVGTYLGSI